MRSSLAVIVLAALAAASCAPLPAPSSAPVPPAPGATGAGGTPAAPVVRPVFRLDAEPMLDVGLAWDLDSVRVATVRRAWFEGPRPGVEIAAGAGEILIVRLARSTSAWERGSGSARELSLAPGDTLFVGEHGSGRDAALRWNGKTWRGRFKIFVNPRGKLTLVDRLPLETYLLGVVPGEIGALSDELLEAGRAQAVAARSYTLFYRGRRGAEGFDLFGTVEDQVYGPVETERPLATRCVEGTRGELALADGGPIRANYCSTCGGITAEAWEAWPTEPLDYLASERDRDGAADHCAASPHYRWREQWSAAEFTANLSRFGPPNGVPVPEGGVGDLQDVRVAARSRSGRVWRLEVTTTRGTILIPAHVLRQVLRRPGNPNAILRSNLFKLDVRRDPATRRAITVVASGAGSGHGVGLCQVGALAMAREGSSAERILAHYYRGVELKRLY